MRRTCFSSAAGSASYPDWGVDQLVVGNAAPQEERKARGQLQIAGFDAEQKFGARQNESQGAFNARVKAIALLIEAQWSFQSCFVTGRR